MRKRLAVRLGRGWAELVGFARLSPERQERELEELRRMHLEFQLVPEGEKFPFEPDKR